MTQSSKDNSSSRRRFLKVAAAGAAATVVAPAVAQAQGPISMRWQSTWPAKDIFHEYALDYAKKVNETTLAPIEAYSLASSSLPPPYLCQASSMLASIA